MKGYEYKLDEAPEVELRRLAATVAWALNAAEENIESLKLENEILEEELANQQVDWDNMDSIGCQHCNGYGGRWACCDDNADVCWVDCETCNGHGLLYARPTKTINQEKP